MFTCVARGAVLLPFRGFEDLVETVEEKFKQVQKVSGHVYVFAEGAIKTLVEFLKPAADMPMPVLQQAGGEAVKIVMPVMSEATKKAQEAIQSGTVLRYDVTGKVLMKWLLSGMPDLKLGLNDKIGLEKE
ncbi:Rhodanese-like domain-containing protein [Artemisia annua]|uniref:Rhodanese-like domain-containing protein n=1 Tax=Artemisia annua TaxID=35608 RepID=A0A2U1Q6Z0_ARTAN|nr:Rhodanese-like domain-containing protein [Artemisia annua]